MRIKAQGLLNATKWIEETHGREGLQQVLRACSPEVRSRYTSVTAIDWHPVEELIELLDQAEKAFGNRQNPGRVCEAIGAAGARANMRGALVRLAIWVSSPEALMKRVAALWSQFNDEGAMSLLSLDDRLTRLEVTGLKAPHILFCSTLTGWTREVCLALHAITPVARHVSCRARGDQKCIWEVRYAGVDAVAPTGLPPSRE